MRTIAHQFLEIESEAFGQIPMPYGELEGILTRAKSTLETGSHAAEVFADISNFFQTEGLERGGDYTDTFATSLSSKGLDCKGFSLLSLAIGQLMGYPLTMVAAPDHFFVRWQDPQKTLNWDHLNDDVLSDEEAIAEWKIPKQSVQSGVYMASLSDREILSSAYVSRATIRILQGDIEEALADYTAALAQNPKNVLAWANRGSIRFLSGHLESSTFDLHKSLDLDPNHIGSHYNLGRIERLSGKGDPIPHFTRVLLSNPFYPDIFQERALAYLSMGDIDNFKEDWLRHIKVKTHN